MSRPGRTGGLDGFLDAASRLEGELRFEQTFRVEGALHGRVVSEGSLVVGEKGVVEGEIRVGRLVVTGTVRGVVTASRRVEIGAGGRVYAELVTPALVIDDGGLFEGPCRMVRSGAAAPAPAARRETSVGELGPVRS